jgi:methylated-DNA-[protein]-cysteine S-methyltransferase
MARRALKEITEYLGGERREFATPVDWRGWPAFTRQVLETCARVPYGTTVSYGELARRVGSPRAARAVGQALGRNPVPLIVPCHRVVRADGGLGGFGGGPALKGRLLELEKPSKGLGPGGWPEQGK